jgi:carboxypeptidase T
MKKISMVLSIVVILLISSNISALNSSTSENKVAHVRESKLHELQNNLPTVTDAGIYHTYDEMTTYLKTLESNNPDIMRLSSLGKTYEDRDIWLGKLSDNVSDTEDEPEVLLMGAHHGNEKPSYEVLIYFIQHMIQNYSLKNTDNDGDGKVNEDPIDGKDNDQDKYIDEDPSEERVREVINNTEIYLIPMLNPDGVEAGTRKNRAPNYGSFGFNKKITSYGVDLNRNYGHRWFFLFFFPKFYSGATSYGYNSSVYRGEKPFCEVETQAVKQLVNNRNFKLCLTYHTYGQLILYPWGYTRFPAKDKRTFESIGKDIKKINNYTLSQSVYLYPTIGDATDWLYGKRGVLSYTIELGTEFAPTNPETLKQICITHVGVNLFICEKAEMIDN